MHIYFDTEFTGLHKETTLISIGMIDDQDHSFYAEFTDYDTSQINPWIQDNVIRNLTHENSTSSNNIKMFGDTSSIRTVLLKWLSNYQEVQFVSDVSHFDFVLLTDLLGGKEGAFGLPHNVTPYCYDINQDIARFLNISDREAFDYSREEFVQKYGNNKISGIKHNSLYDANVIREIYKIISFDEKPVFHITLADDYNNARRDSVRG